MSSLRDYIGPAGKMLARRLDHLCSTLESLSVRLRDTIANAVGETIGAIVRDTALGVLGEVTRYFPPEPPAIYRQPRNQPFGNGYEPDQRGYWPEEEEVEYDRESPERQTVTDRLPTALSAGLQAAAWWLRRWSGQSRVLTTLAVGTIATGIAFLGGPLAVALLTLAGSAAQCTDLSEIIGTGEPAYNRYGPA